MSQSSQNVLVGAALAASIVLTVASSHGAVVQYDVSLIPNASSLAASIGLDAPLTGTFQGDFDPVDNPSGTQTRPGLFGGSGNNPIGYTATLGAAGDIDAQPTGGLLMNLDLEDGTVAIVDLAMDLLGGDIGAIDLTIEVNYNSFNTINPTAIFPGEFTVPLPLGTGTIQAFTATQSGPAQGTVIDTGKTTATVSVLVPVDLLLTAEFNGTPIGGVPLPGVLPLVGTIDFGGESVTINLVIDGLVDLSEPVEPPLAFADIPLPLPTVLPPGGTANLLLGGTVSSLSLLGSLSLDALADAVPNLAPGDLDGDGSIGASDLAILLGAWGSTGPGDLDGNGTVGASDLAILLGAWG